MAEERKSYDSAYKFLFSSKYIFHQFLTRFIHESFTKKITIDDIELIDKSFVTDDFRQRESDIIYKVQTGKKDVYIYVLTEFQSTVDKSIPVRMLLYILQLYDMLMRNSKKGKLPAVFPILLYNGSEEWTIPHNLIVLIEPSISSRYIPSFEYYPVIENSFSEKTLKKLKGIVSAVFYMENQKEEEKLAETISTVIDLIEEESPEQYRMFSIWVKNMFNLEEESIDQINQLTEVKSMLAQLAEKIENRGLERGLEQGIERGLERGLEQGLERGLEQGVHKKAVEDARKMKEKMYPLEDISEISGLTIKEIQDL